MAMGNRAGEADRGALRLDFDRHLLLQFRGSAITSDAGLLAYRELDDTLRPTDTGADTLADARTGKWPDVPADRALYDALDGRLRHVARLQDRPEEINMHTLIGREGEPIRVFEISDVLLAAVGHDPVDRRRIELALAERNA